MTELPSKPTRKITDDPYGAAILIRRLVMEQGFVYWRRYLTAFALMGVSASATAGSAYILGQVINQAYIDKNVVGIAILSGVTVVLLFIKGLATYGHTVILSKISNAILANNQRRLFAKLMSESIGFYSERHSSEFLARLTSGAKSITDVLTLLINAVGRDVLLLVSLIFVMVTQDPVLSFIGLVVVPPAMLILRKLVKRIKGLAHNQFTGSADIMETMQESLQGIRTVKAFTLEAAMQRRIDENIAIVERNANKMARVSNRSNPLMEMLGGWSHTTPQLAFKATFGYHVYDHAQNADSLGERLEQLRAAREHDLMPYFRVVEAEPGPIALMPEPGLSVPSITGRSSPAALANSRAAR